VNELLAILQELGILVIVGSTGTGKTTLAKLTATKCVGPWFWVSFAAHDPHEYGHALQSLAILLEQKPEASSIVLDDVNLSPEHSRQLEDYFAGLLYTILRRKGHLVITGQKELPQRLSRHLGLLQKSTQVAPALTKEEIADLAVQLGCQSKEDAQAWAVITLIHTSGHVQLVHAQVKDLARQGSTPDALAMMGDNNLPSDVRLFAATRLMSDLDSGVDRLFNAQVWIVSWLGQSKMFWNYDVANYFASHLARVWKKQCAFRAALRNPRLTVPEIERECDSKDEGIAKAARILLAVANAVTIQLSDEFRRQLQALASIESVNPYRFA
jgi:hypothetical protein